MNESRAGDETRTRDIQLGRLTLYHLSYSRVSVNSGGRRIRTFVARCAPGLQPGPFGHSGIPPTFFVLRFRCSLPLPKLAIGFEPTTRCLQSSRSTIELRQRPGRRDLADTESERMMSR